MGADNPYSPSESPLSPELALAAGRRGATLDGTVLVDARALQDERFQARGIGGFLTALLQGRLQHAVGTHLTAVVDPALPTLAAEAAALFDQVQVAAYRTGPVAALLLPSPMTHPILPFARTFDEAPFTAAIIHDFIPAQYPDRYLAAPSAHQEYVSRLVWLRRATRFYANSAHTGSDLSRRLGVGTNRILVTGIPVRASLAGAAAPPRDEHALPYFVVAGGDDWRKNVELAIQAHGRSAALAQAGVRLVVLGGYSASRMAELRAVHMGAGGRTDLLAFRHRLSDAELRAAYEEAVAAVVPSRAEGFSLPIIEAAFFGTPVIASDCPAQAELLDDPLDLFDPDDARTLQHQMEVLHADRIARQEARDRQAGLAERFSSALVCGRFWTDFLTHAVQAQGARKQDGIVRAPAVIGRGRPSIAFATPLPPAASGVADFSAATLAALGRVADVTVYTDTPDPVLPAVSACRVEPLGPLGYLSRRHDATVSVLGNSHFHLGVFNELMAWGSATIAHDSRMVNFYSEMLGSERALAAARKELGRDVTAAELQGWLVNQSTLPALFLDEVAAVSRPLLLHSAVTVGLLRARGIEAGLLPFSPYTVLPERALTPAARAAARSRFGIPPEVFVVATFGNVNNDRAIEDCIGAVEMLRFWKVPVALVCVGPVVPPLRAYLESIAATIGVKDHVRFTGSVSAREYMAWLQSADAAVQLRTYAMGGLSGALLDCMAAAVPTVANEHLAEAMDAPPSVRRVPNAISAVLVADALLAAYREGMENGRERPLEERRILLRERGFPVYAAKLLQALGFEAAPA